MNIIEKLYKVFIFYVNKIRGVFMDVSVIVPVYNTASYLTQCLNSLLNQKTKFSYEIICINDGSTDDSLNILNSYKDKIKVLNIKNQGPGAARNTGIRHAKGKYLMFVDSDDYVNENFIQKLLEPVKNYSADVGICDFYRVNDKNLVHIHKGEVKTYTYGNFQEPLLMEFHSANKVFKKEIFSYYPENMFFEDVVAIANSLLNAKKIVKIDEALYYYRYVADSTTNTLTSKAYDICKATKMIEKRFLEEGYEKVIEFLYINNILVDLCIKIVKAKGKQAKKEVYAYLDEITNKYPMWYKNEFLKKSRFMKRIYLFFLRHHIYGIINIVYGLR